MTQAHAGPQDGPSAGPGEEDAIAATRRWVEQAVIGLNLCPFAKAVYVKDQVRLAYSDATTPGQLLEQLGEELLLLRDAPAEQVDTTLLVHPHVLQVASFHPDYRFADSDPDDIENHSNRSPFPTLHLLREDSIDRAVEAYPDPDAIVERNYATLRQLGHAGWQRLFED